MFFIHADGSCVGRVFSVICVSICLYVVCTCVFPRDISKSDAARITKLDMDMVHHES